MTVGLPCQYEVATPRFGGIGAADCAPETAALLDDFEGFWIHQIESRVVKVIGFGRTAFRFFATAGLGVVFATVGCAAEVWLNILKLYFIIDRLRRCFSVFGSGTAP